MQDAINDRLKQTYEAGFTTDVESEINGLLTYDRNYKLDPEILRSIHSQIVNR